VCLHNVRDYSWSATRICNLRVTKIKADEIGRPYSTYRAIKKITEGIMQELKMKDHCG